MIDIDDVRKEALIKHGITIEKDDPILTFLAVHDQINQQGIAELSDLINQLKAQQEKYLTEAAEQHKANTEALRELINTAANNTLDHAGKEIAKSNKAFADEIEKLLQAPFENQVQNNTMLHLLVMVAAGSALFTLIMLGMFIFMT